MDAEAYVLEFLALGDRLRAHENVALTNFYVGDGAPTEALEEAEVALGRPLPRAVRALYAAADGLQLRYILRDHPDFEPGRYDRNEGAFEPCYPGEEELLVSACVNVVPLGVLVDPGACDVPFRGWTDAPVHILEETYDAADFFDRLFLFDYFHEVLDAALFLGRNDRAFVLLSSGHHALHPSSRPIDVESYLRFVLHRAGDILDREALAQRPPQSEPFRKTSWSRFDDHPLTTPPDRRD